MKKATRVVLAVVAVFAVTIIVGCKSTSKAKVREVTIVEYEIKLTTATNENAGATAQLALIVDYNDPAQPSRQTLDFGEKRYVEGQTTTIKVKATRTIPWKNRSQITFSISTQSPDGYLPSNIWIAAISNKKSRFTMRDAGWKDRMFSTEANDPEAVGPVESAREWVITDYED